ncbi:hypothetical protein GN244_ATG18827 [Phytophthora infestans]|uniref:Secreted RxLR effector peptide protein n=1 Tax=Phytophthora infestans TaxID=4787 RepID=A0A833VUL5_PHYIN|nr:hypothetical protein GN244_ATG18827 [Phytophthora infestans]KAF4138582.1 hypothetical protein GN958_ATG12230 [Phytophthora infestans]
MLVIVAFVTWSTIATAENAAEFSPNVPNKRSRYLTGSKTTADLGALNEERVGATTPSFKQLFGLFKLPKISSFPGQQQLKAFLKKLDARRIARLRKKYDANIAHGF